MILFNSSTIRSREMISMRALLRSMASKVSGSMKKPSCVAKRMARIMRKGSSLKVISGSSGVRIVKSSRSSMPPNGSTNSPYRSAFRHRAMALIVKSLRFWSSSKEPFSTTGFRLSWLYDSLRAPTNSNSKSSHFTCAVPKFLNTESDTLRPNLCATFLASSMPLPTATMSISFE